MSEREIRSIIRAVCADLDERAKRAAKKPVQKVLIPAALGVSLTMSGCTEPIADRDDDVQYVDGGEDAQANPPDTTDASVQPQPLYAAPLEDSGITPLPDASTDGASPEKDAGMVAIYAAPLPDSGPIPPYMAPSVDSGVAVDAGPVLEYMAPAPDAGPQLLYMAPDPSPVPIYAAASPEEEE